MLHKTFNIDVLLDAGTDELTDAIKEVYKAINHISDTDNDLALEVLRQVIDGLEDIENEID
jgi:uncharacterized protein Yka (UPF0111/DUF47 family)